MTTLYHYTCAHGRAWIDDLLVPASHQSGRAIGTPGEYVWLTDLARPQRDALGLTSHILDCDRTEYRYRVTNMADVLPWTAVRRAWRWAHELESAPGARPRHWWVSAGPVAVIYDPVPALANDASP